MNNIIRNFTACRMDETAYSYGRWFFNLHTEQWWQRGGFQFWHLAQCLMPVSTAAGSRTSEPSCAFGKLDGTITSSSNGGLQPPGTVPGSEKTTLR